MPKSTLYHNPRCSKSRQALALLNERNEDYTLVEYLKTPLHSPEIESIYRALLANGVLKRAHDMLRTNEAEYKQSSLSSQSSDAEVISAIATFPKLLERPIYKVENLAAIGRPIENIEALLHE